MLSATAWHPARDLAPREIRNRCTRFVGCHGRRTPKTQLTALAEQADDALVPDFTGRDR